MKSLQNEKKELSLWEIRKKGKMVAVALKKEKTITIPKALMYEMLEGVVVPYRGYQKVLAKKLKVEDIIGSSGLQ